jgi:hypothetical protein
MAEPSNPLGLPPTVWIVLVVGLAGVFAVNRQPFQDVRPADASVAAYRHIPSEDQDVEARQWEDPFTAVAIARHTLPADKVNAAGADSHSETQHTIERLRAEMPKSGSRVLIMGAMVPGAPYANDVETRRRTRYAVLAGLFAAGYVPDNSEHIGYLTLPVYGTDILRARDIAAYEWFHSESQAEGARQAPVLLLWLDQDAFRESPLARFSSIINASVPQEAEAAAVSSVIVGPADSDSLKTMSNELDQKSAEPCEFLSKPARDIAIYSPRATALDWWIVSDAVRKRYPQSPPGMPADHFHDRCPHVTLYRTVASDYTVVRALFSELRYRGIQNVSEIALVTERDTLYARLMSHYFNGCDGADPVKEEFTVSGGLDQPGTGDFKPLCFTYLKGLDGLTPPAPDTGASVQSQSDSKPDASGSAPQAPQAEEAATGQSQLDYLRRLTATLAARRDDPTCRWLARTLGGNQLLIKQRCGHHIKAIGVVGSDIYDKLLVLQALRRAFPRYIFFTTDLDARLTDGQNLRWTRELVIGSSLGLTLRPGLQGSIPPFRDSYQTSTYYSTIEAVNRFVAGPDAEAVDLSWTRRAHVFEIGRSQAYDLSAETSADAPCEARGTCRSIAAWRQPPPWSTGSFLSYLTVAVVGVAVAAVIATMAMGAPWVFGLFRKQDGPQPRRRLFITILVSLGIAMLAVWAWGSLVDALGNDHSRIPTPIFSGASHWAASMFEGLSVLMVATLVIRGQRKLRQNAVKMLDEFKFPNPVDKLTGAYIDSLSIEKRRRERWWFPIRRLSGNKNDPLPIVQGFSALEMLMSQYLYRGRWTARLLRVLSATLVASGLLLILEYILMVLEFNLGVSLVNGFSLVDVHYVERGIEDIISLLNLFAVQFLIFWAADAMLLTRSFVLALAQDRPDWPGTVLKQQSADLRLLDTWTAMWLDLRLIAWRTGWVSRLIWYPSLMVAAMAAAALTVEFGEFGFASNPIALVISAAFVVTAAVLLRRVAESWRSDVLFKIEDARIRATGAHGPDGGQVAQLDRLLERITALNDGAFAPYSQQPLVRAVLVPALTYGATAGLQYLHISP